MNLSRYILLTFASLLLSCAKEKGKVNTETQIRFDADIVSTPEVKGLPITPLNASSMGVYAYFTQLNSFDDVAETATPNWLNNVAINRSGNNAPWATADVVYWPAYDAVTLQSKLSFFAYAPYATENNGITLQALTGVPHIQLDLQEDISSQTDLLLAASERDKNKTQNEGHIEFKFAHVLTKIGFKGYCYTPGVTMLSITLTNLKYSGEIEMDTPRSWVLNDDLKDFVLNLNGMPLSSNPQKPTLLSDPNNYFLLFPADYSTTSQTELIVVYNEKKEQKTMKASITEKWDMGKSILYSLNLGGNATSDMMIESVSIQDWIIDGKEDIDAN